MRKLAVLVFQTLDGVMQAPSQPEEDMSGGFTYGGWAGQYWNDVMEQVSQEAMAQPYDLLLGRQTYTLFAAHFASLNNDNPIARQLNNAKKYVVTSTEEPLKWPHSVKISGNIVDYIIQLKKQSGLLLQVHGSWQLIQTLLANQLVDELRLWTFPVIVGSGKRLFTEGSPAQQFHLLRSKVGESGVLMHFYQKHGDNNTTGEIE
ncbi:dihydrofolate reductase family protein [uncultured Shewanella sp.]|uniref:dihydrofolate reductase family protein n=1 Tax=uncultured Shewanella sp. TaxID=173975 RepID=UPI00262F9506|nr:dihydrofolate reductase family protein [uncultured Shewanella sp.]